MEKSEQILPERVIELLKENGIIVSAEQAEQLLKLGNVPSNISLPASQLTSAPQIVKGYKVYVQYESLSDEEMNRKKIIVTRIVSQAIKK